jgi:membrane protease subunit HflK
MPWNSNNGGPKSGGPWGSGGGGGNNPWGSGGGGGNRGGGGPFGGQRPPDLEDMIRRGQDQLKNLIPGGFRSAPGILLVVLAAVLLWLMFGFFRVQTNEQAIKLVFGRPVGLPVGEGLSWNIYWPIGSVIKVDVLKQTQVTISDGSPPSTRGRPGTGRQQTTENLMLTGDENIVNVHFGVIWQIKDITKFVFNTRDPEGTVRAAAESAMRQVIGKSELQFALGEGRSRVEQESREELQRILDFYGTGVQITQLQLQSVDPPGLVLDAFRDVQAARADKERKINEANGYRNEIVPRAKGEGEAMVQAAEGYRTEVVNRSSGDAQRFVSIYNQFSLAKDITVQRIYLETMEEILRGANKVLIDNREGGPGVVPYLPLPEIQKQQQRAVLPPAPGASGGSATPTQGAPR